MVWMIVRAVPLVVRYDATVGVGLEVVVRLYDRALVPGAVLELCNVGMGHFG